MDSFSAAARALTALLCLMWAVAAEPVHAQTEIPPLTGRVMDPADIISPSTERTLTALLQTHEDSTGNQIVVATVPSLGGEAIEEYALRAGRTWQIGTAEHDNGILLIVAPSERKVRIEVGYGLEGAVPDAVAARIIRNEIIPEFRDGDFDAGVAAGTMALLEAARGEYEVEESAGGDDVPPLAVRIVFCFVFGIVLLTIGFGALTAKSKVGRWIALVVLLPFVFVVGGFAGMSFWTGLAAALIYGGLFSHLAGKPSVQRLRERMAEAAKKGETVPVALGPFTMHVGGSSGGGSGGGSFGGGGGGFSGGGGSFGGGGASGGW